MAVASPSITTDPAAQQAEADAVRFTIGQIRRLEGRGEGLVG
ncbi:hypothetical protein [Nitrospirillum sp. BR 11163]|nr:hypothetical protein [Nitrospirillum sp. BR 11163]MEA1675282.1 hypothetical protein [Nitrospirillum sp. BR 11163]